MSREAHWKSAVLGEVIAEIRPLSRPAAGSDSVDDVLDSLAGTGEVSRARLAKKNWKWVPRPLGLTPGKARALIDELRTDRT